MDYLLFRLINGLAGQWRVADELFRLFANDYVVPTVLVAMLVALWFSGHEAARRVVLQALLALVLVNALVALSNLLLFRPRPFTAHEATMLFYYPSDSSFPSNSASAMWALAWAIWLHERGGRMGWAAVILATLMGTSRVWVGVHYPLDIVGGALFGIVAATLVQRAAPRLAPLLRGMERLAARLALR